MWWICSLGKSWEFSICSLGSWLKVPQRFSECKPEAASEVRPSAKSVAEDAAEGLPEENPEGYFQSTLLGTNLELEGLPKGTDSPHYTQGFSTDCHSNQISTVNKRTEWKSSSSSASSSTRRAKIRASFLCCWLWRGILCLNEYLFLSNHLCFGGFRLELNKAIKSAVDLCSWKYIDRLWQKYLTLEKL